MAGAGEDWGAVFPFRAKSLQNSPPILGQATSAVMNSIVNRKTGRVAGALPADLYTAAQVRELDRVAIEDQGIPSITLMERAGAGAYDVLTTRYPAAKNLIVVCGGGNNAGDGYVTARLAKENGLNVKVISLVAPDKLRGDAGICAKKFLDVDVIGETVSPTVFAGADLIVDALLGTGLARDVSGRFAGVIGLINVAAAPVLAIDIPSGLNADTGNCMGMAVKADATLTFIGLKRGLFTGAGPEFCGEILFSDLGTPANVHAKVSAGARLIEPAIAAKNLPARPRHAHKGHYGHALVIGGDYGYLGAVVLAGSAAARVGSGLVTVATRAEHANHLSLFRPELMTVAAASSRDLNVALDRASVVAIGPGLGQSDWAMELFARVLQTRHPLVVDADALNLLAADPQRRQNWVLTPHPGEAARLLGVTTKELQVDRFESITSIQDKFGGVIVLKGAGSLVMDAKGLIHLNKSGNPGMAGGGMGDVLTGVIAGLIAQGMEPDKAAATAVYLHGHAADVCAAGDGERGMLAGDLLPVIRSLVNPG